MARSGGLSYLHIPADDVARAAQFYASVFGWKITGADTQRPSFEDGTGHVAGAWMSSLSVAREPGLLLYVYVEGIEAVVDRIMAAGGEVVRAPYPEGNLKVATFRDPAGNVLGLWEAQNPG